MITVYALALGLGIVALIVIIMGSSYATNVDRTDRDPNRRIGVRGRMVLGGLLGFGMGGMAAEFSPLAPDRVVSLVIALAAAGASVAWVRYAGTNSGS